MVGFFSYGVKCWASLFGASAKAANRKPFAAVKTLLNLTQ